MKFLCIICLCSMLLPGFSQSPADSLLPRYLPESVQRAERSEMPSSWFSFSISVPAFSNSTHVPSAFSNAFLFPGFIDESLKQQSFSRLKPTGNRFGAEASPEVGILFSTGKKPAQKQAFGFSYGVRSFYTAVYPEDIFRVVFGGNRPFAGRTALFDDTRIHFLSYQTLSLDYLIARPAFELKFSGGIVHGLQQTELTIHQGKLFTEASGEYLELAFSGNLTHSDAFDNQLSNNPSLGGTFGFSVKTRLGKIPLWFSAGDMGFIRWNNNTLSLKRDTAFRFSGIQIPDIFNLNDSTLLVGDTLLSALRGPEKREMVYSLLPALFQIALFYPLNSQSHLDFSLRHRHLNGYLPLIRAGYSRNLGKFSSITVHAAYGAFGKLQTGVAFVPFNTRHHYLKISTWFNEGFLFPRKWAGNGFSLGYCLSL